MVAAGGAGTQESVGTEEGGWQQRGGERREGRSREARAASEPESWSCRSPATLACALRSGREPLSLAGRRRTPRSGQEPGEKVRRQGHLGRTRLGELSGAATSCLPRTEGSRVGRPARSAGGAATERPRRDKDAGRDGALPAAARSGRGRPAVAAAGEGGATAQTLYKGASPARRRRRRRADATKVCSLRGAEGSLPRPAQHPGPPKPHLGSRGARLPSAVAGAHDMSGGGQRAPRSAGAAAPPRQRGC